MNSLLNVFYFDKDGNLIQLDDILARQQDTPIVPPEPDPNVAIIGGRAYKTVTIGDQTWLAENLDFKFTGCAIGQDGISSAEPRANYYDNNEDIYGVNGNKYGLLYNWIAVKYLVDRQNTENDLIPGWHVPTSDEWDALANVVGGYGVAGSNLKSTTGWTSGNGNGQYGFNAFPAGSYSGSSSVSFRDVGSIADFWTATESDSSNAYYRQLKTGATMYSNDVRKASQYSVRLVKNSPEPVPPEPDPPEPDPSIVVIGGRSYKTVTIGDQTWLAENLDFKFDGLIIGEEFETYQKPVATYYNNDESTYGVNGNKYGLLYNNNAAITLEDRKSELIPGWHVPTLEDWQTLIEYVGGVQTEVRGHYEDAGTTLKSTTGWVEENGDDNFGFNAFPAGESDHGNSNGIGESAYFWTSEYDGSDNGWLSCYLSDVDSETIISNPSGMYSIRLIKD